MKSLLKLTSVVCLIGVLFTVSSCGFPTPQAKFSYSLTGDFSFGAFGEIKITLDPIPSGPQKITDFTKWLHVDVTVGRLHFNSDDPAFQCLLNTIPLLFKNEEDFPGLYLVALPICASMGQTSSNTGSAMAAVPLEASQTDYYAAFEFPQNDSALCKTVYGSTGCFPSRQPPPIRIPVTPTPTPTPIPTTTAFHGITLYVYVNGKFYSNAPATNPLTISRETPVELEAAWYGGSLNGTGWEVALRIGAAEVVRCNTGTSCVYSLTFTDEVQNAPYFAVLISPDGGETDSQNVFINWI